MSSAGLWITVAIASLLCFGLKLAGHLLPERLLTEPRVARTAALVTAALLAALVAVQTFSDGRSLTVDARLPALAVAAVALWRKLPFIVVVLLAALTAAALRAAGWAS